MLAGAGLAFARAVGEFGSVVLISGNLPFKTEVASSWIYSLSQSDELTAGRRHLGGAGGRGPAGAAGHRAAPAPLRHQRGRYDLPVEVAAADPGPRLPRLPGGAPGRLHLLPGLPARVRHGLGRGDHPRRPPRPVAHLHRGASSPSPSTPCSASAWPSSCPATGSPGPGCSTPSSTCPWPSPPWWSGISLILVYGKTGWFGNWLAERGIQVIFSVPGIIMASATVALPYVVREVLPVLQEIGTDQEQAATTLGAKPFAIFRRITLPSIQRSLAYGVTLTTARVTGRVRGGGGGLRRHRREDRDPHPVHPGQLREPQHRRRLRRSGHPRPHRPGGPGHLRPWTPPTRGTRARRRKHRWRSPSDPSPSDSATPLPSTTSASMSPTAH